MLKSNTQYKKHSANNQNEKNISKSVSRKKKSEKSISQLKLMLVIIKILPDFIMGFFSVSTKKQKTNFEQFEGSWAQRPRLSEAVARRCSVKKQFLNILENSQENTRVEVSFCTKMQTLRPDDFLWILRIFQAYLFLLKHIR